MQVMRFEAGETDAIEPDERQELRFAGREGAAPRLLIYGMPVRASNSAFCFSISTTYRPAFGRARGRLAISEQNFRQAVSAAIDREAIVRLVYKGRATALGGPPWRAATSCGSTAPAASGALAGACAGLLWPPITLECLGGAARPAG